MSQYQRRSWDVPLSDRVMKDEIAVLSQLKRQFAAQIRGRWPEGDGLFTLAAAVILDPRFMQFHPYSSERFWARSCNRLGDLIEMVDAPGASVPTVAGADAEPAAKRLRRWTDEALFGPDLARGANESQRSSPDGRGEPARYLNEPRLPLDKDPLLWWNLHGDIHPKMRALARRILCIPTTSVASERTFSKADILVSRLRTALDPATVDMIVTMNFNWNSWPHAGQAAVRRAPG